MTRPIIEVEGLSKCYRLGQINAGSLRDEVERFVQRLRGQSPPADAGDFWALRDVSFQVQPGEVVGIVGRNGAGKSTLLKILSRVTEPTAGEVRIRGRVASLLEVGTGFHPELSGRENIYLNGAILGMTRAEIAARFDEIVDFSGVEQFLDTPVKRYSSGMYVRLAFAVAAHLEPEVLVVDEVLAVGDAEFQRKCLGKMQEVSGRDGRTVLFVSHNMAAVSKLCSRACLMAGGQLVASGPATEITQAYLVALSSGGAGADGRSATFESGRGRIAVDAEAEGLRIKAVSVENGVQSGLGATTGEPLVVTIEYSAAARIPSPAFVVMIADEFGTEVLRLSTTPISGYAIDELHADGVVTLRISSLPLVSGRYTLSVGFVQEGSRWLIDLEGLIELFVNPKDVYGGGLALDRRRGIIVADHAWRHEPAVAGVAAGRSERTASAR